MLWFIKENQNSEGRGTFNFDSSFQNKWDNCFENISISCKLYLECIKKTKDTNNQQK